MRRTTYLTLLLLLAGFAAPGNADERLPWTASKLIGTPEPPPPLTTANAYPQLEFNQPTVLTNAPHSNRLFVSERFGKVFSFVDDSSVAEADLFIDLKADLTTLPEDGSAKGVGSVYGIAFHPEYPVEPYVYICYTLQPDSRDNPLLDGTRVSRFEVAATDPPRALPESEQIVITWREGGHNGGCLKFGPDGYLYISTGDATPPSPPDGLLAGQDVSNLLSSILRIDVAGAASDAPYTVPQDNPFVALPDVRPEIWAYGFRNPWKMSFDRGTGQLWLGDVGWELWEMVYHVEKGGNYGWSVMEGPQPVDLSRPRGPTAISPPAFSLPHSQSSSITGGFVYRGERFPELVGKYIFGDYDTRGLWAGTIENGRITDLETIAPPLHRVVAFAEKQSGELLIVDFNDGTIHELVRNPKADIATAFPHKLSETGLFDDVAGEVPQSGVYEFDINAPMWMDGATARRFVALPGESSVAWYPSPRPIPGTSARARLFFPENAVLAKTIHLETRDGLRNVETQVLQHDGRFWNAYTYRWNAAQTDAELMPAQGGSATYEVPDAASPNGWSRLTWTFHGRNQCLRCHNRWNEHALAFNLDQLTSTASEKPDELTRVLQLGLLHKVTEENGNRLTWPASLTAGLVDLQREDASLDHRARSYLHVNCSHCHQRGAGGTALIDLRYDLDVESMKLMDAVPLQGHFDLPDARLVVPGAPSRSVLFHRMAVTGTGHMPHIGAERVDPQGVQLIHDWIGAMDATVEDNPAALAKLETMAANGGSDSEVAASIDKLLETTRGRLALAAAYPEWKQRSPHAAKEVLARVLEHDDRLVRRYFTRHLAPDERLETLGTQFDQGTLLAMPGDADRGEELFRAKNITQCVRCHRVKGEGGAIGPALDDVGKRLTKVQLLESLVDPSLKIAPEFRTWLAVTTQGKVLSGLRLDEASDPIRLVDAQGTIHTLEAGELEELQPQRASLMPDQLLKDLTPQQAADLLTFLSSLRTTRDQVSTAAP